MSPERATRPLLLALGAIALLSPAALNLGVRYGHMEAPPSVTEGDMPGLAWRLVGLLVALLVLCVVAHALDTRRSPGRDTR